VSSTVTLTLVFSYARAKCPHPGTAFDAPSWDFPKRERGCPLVHTGRK